MNKLLIALMISTISFSTLAATKVSINDGRVRVQQNGITKEYGTVRDVKERNGKVEVYTNRNFSSPAITINKRGDITTQRSSSDSSFTCRYNCSVESDDE